jgi:2-oxoisovalerate dehydrogenase E1 component alpha subunit
MDDVLRVIRDDGHADPATDPKLSKDEVISLYRFMLLERTLDLRMLSLQRQGRIGFYGPSVGQEAAIVGAAFAMEPRDWIFPQYREPGAALVRGMPLTQLTAQFFGNDMDAIKGRQMPCHYVYREGNFMSISSCVGTQIPLAVGAAWAAKIRKDPIVSLVYFGDGGTSTGDFHVGMNFAGVFGAPVVFLCNNNQWAISLPVRKQTAAATLAQKAAAYGFEGVRVDGMDALAVVAAVRAAQRKARGGGGPTLVEAVTYRLGPHSSSDDPTRYRDDKEVEPWRRRDPINGMRKHLVARGIWDDDAEKRLQQELDDAITEAVHAVERSPPPPLEAMFTDVYAEMPWHLREQLADLRAVRGGAR